MTILMRYFIETFTFMILSSVSSISRISVTESYPIASLLVNLIYLQGVLFVCVVISRVILRKRSGEYEKNSDNLIEISRGICDKPISYIYIYVFMLRRLLSAICIVASMDLTSRGRIGIFIMIQVFWLAYDCMRHFDCLAIFAMELYNDAVYIILCIIILIWNDMTDWNNGLIGLFYFLISPVGIAVFLVTKLIIWYRTRNLVENDQGKSDIVDSNDIIQENREQLLEEDNKSEELDDK